MRDSLNDPETPLYRYVKSFMINRYGRIQKSLFADRPGIDFGLLSVTDGSTLTPEEAYNRFSAGKKNRSPFIRRVVVPGHPNRPVRDEQFTSTIVDVWVAETTTLRIKGWPRRPPSE